MSNSRKMKRSLKRNIGMVSAATLGLGTLGAGIVVVPSAASAATVSNDPISLYPSGSSAATVYPGKSAQPATSVQLVQTNSSAAGFESGNTIDLAIEPNNAPNTAPVSGTSTAVTFTTLPTVSVTPASGDGSGDYTPTFTEKLQTNPADPTADNGIQDELVLTFTNTAADVNPTDTFDIVVSGIEYTVGADATASNAGSPVDLNEDTTGESTTYSVENAKVVNYTFAENPTGVATGSTGNSLANAVLTETTFGVLPVGKYTLAADDGSFTGSLTVTATGVTVAAVPASNTCPTTGGSSSATIVASGGTYTFCVVSQSTTTTGAGSLTLSGITYNAPDYSDWDTVTLSGPDSLSYSSATQPAVTVVDLARVAGATADDTAAAAAESLYPDGLDNYPAGGAVMLASDSEYQDALSASYLGYAGLKYQPLSTRSGATQTQYAAPLLLNPYDAPNGGESSTAAGNAIRKLGATTVYIIGGTDAISADVATQLSQTQVGTEDGNPVYLQVIRIAGVTSEQTAADVAQYGTYVGTLPNTPGAYGMYNSGASETAAPTTGSSLKTAILADADEFQDALAASPLAYSNVLPVLLTGGDGSLDPNAANAITNLGIQQVIIVGGSSAVSNAAASDLSALNVSVLRIAGTTFDATAQELAEFEVNDYTAPGSSQARDGLDSDTEGAPEAVGVQDELTVGTSRGDAYQDALSSAQVLGYNDGDYAQDSEGGEEVVPLLLNTNTSTVSTGTADFLSSNGTGPAGGLARNTGDDRCDLGTVHSEASHLDDCSVDYENIEGMIVFGGTLAQTPAVVQAELNDIAAG